jgi:peptidoglycan hydrolase CwlO-like protein
LAEKTRRYLVMKAIVLALLACGLLILGSACSRTKEGSVEDLNNGMENPVGTETPAASGSQDTAASQQQFVVDMRSQVESIKKQVTDLEGETAKLDEDTREEATQRLEDVKTKLTDLEGKLAQAQTAQGGDFESLKSEIESEVEDTRAQAEEVASAIGS